jgi:hypothetical protein
VNAGLGSVGARSPGRTSSTRSRDGELAHVAQRHRLDPLVEAVSHQQQIVSIVATRVAKATVKHAMETPNLP